MKNFLAFIRWGKLNNEQKMELKSLPFCEVFKRPYLSPKLYKHY